MARCHVCESLTDRTGAVYRCSYCGEPVCEAHRLPENHGCVGPRNEENPNGADGPQSADFSGSNLPGSSPRRKRRRTDSGPDVNPDGSISESDAAREPEAVSERSLFDRLRAFLFG